MELTTRLVTEESELRESLDVWRAMAPTPMQMPEWMLAWWSAFRSPNCQLAVILVESGRRVVGLAPFFLRNSWSLGRTIRFLGSGRACSDFQTLLVRDCQHREVADAVADRLLDPTQNENWGFVELDGVSKDCPAISHLLTRLEAGGCMLHTSQLESTWRLDLSGSWDGYLAGLPRSQRSKTRNLVNRADKNDQLEFNVFRASHTISDALATCMDLHQKRWTESGEPGCFSDPRFVNFIENACGGLADQAMVEIASLRVESRPIASALFLRDDNGVVYLYQTGRDPVYDQMSAGRMLQYLCIRSACQTGATSVDFLRGNEEYKSRLRAEPSTCLRVRAVAPLTAARMRHTLWSLGRGLKHGATSLGSKILTEK